MAITSNAQRVQVNSPAKNGLLLTQAGLGANQVRLPTLIAVNNGNLMTSPTFANRLIIIREGEPDQEMNLITSVDVDGLTCTCQWDWINPPVLGDDYAVAYVLDDVDTVTGCTFDTVTREFVFDRKLEIGQSPASLAFLCATGYQKMRMSDEGLQPALEVQNGAHLAIGTGRGTQTTPGAKITFTHDGDGEECMLVQNGAVFCAFDFVFESARAAEGVNLEVKIIAGGKLMWGEGTLLGIIAPMGKRKAQFKELDGTFYGTVKDVKDNLASLNGWCTGDADTALLDALAGEPDGAKVYIVIEDGNQ